MDQHVIERLARTSYGGRIGFRWERGLGLTNEDIEALQACLLVAFGRLRAAAEAAGAAVDSTTPPVTSCGRLGETGSDRPAVH